MHHLLEIWFSWVLTGGYVGIIVLMAMGSTPLPVPAEVVLPPAAFLAAQGKLNPAGVILAGTVGAYLGAAFMYWISRWIGRPLILRFGRFILLTPSKLQHAEHWLNRYEAGGVFFARVLPVVRHLISIPAGIVRMNFPLFSRPIGRHLACCYGLCRPLHVNRAVDEASFRPIIRPNRLTDFRWILRSDLAPDSAFQGTLCSKVEQKCRRTVSLNVHKH